MSVTSEPELTEHCPGCDRNTPHEVAIEILEESATSKHAEYSREPYRVTTCRRCGEETKTRMNDV